MAKEHLMVKGVTAHEATMAEQPPVFAVNDYPKEAVLLDGTRITLRLMLPEDEERLLAFFLTIPDQERRYLKEDVACAEVIARWSRELDYTRTMPLLALDGDRIVGDATLHRRRAVARSHVGELRVAVDKAYRGKGLGTVMLRELVALAIDVGLERLSMELVPDEQAQALEAAERLGFARVATLPNQVKDTSGRPHDVAIMELPLGRWYEWWQF